MIYHLEHCAPKKNLARFYRIEVVPTLFGTWSVRRVWGRIGSWGQLRQATFSSCIEAEAAAAKLVRQKALRGYISCEIQAGSELCHA